eukprot:Opistho-1_new@70298
MSANSRALFSSQSCSACSRFRSIPNTSYARSYSAMLVISLLASNDTSSEPESDIFFPDLPFFALSSPFFVLFLARFRRALSSSSEESDEFESSGDAARRRFFPATFFDPLSAATAPAAFAFPRKDSRTGAESESPAASNTRVACSRTVGRSASGNAWRESDSYAEGTRLKCGPCASATLSSTSSSCATCSPFSWSWRNSSVRVRGRTASNRTVLSSSAGTTTADGPSRVSLFAFAAFPRDDDPPPFASLAILLSANRLASSLFAVAASAWGDRFGAPCGPCGGCGDSADAGREEGTCNGELIAGGRLTTTGPDAGSSTFTLVPRFVFSASSYFARVLAANSLVMLALTVILFSMRPATRRSPVRTV